MRRIDFRWLVAAACVSLVQTSVLSAEFEHVYAQQTTNPAAQFSIDCLEAIDQSTSLNGTELFSGAGSCFREEKHNEGTFLLIAGQVRSMTDLSLLSPLTDDDRTAASDLAGLIWFQAGGVGYHELYRDPLSTHQLFNRLDQWIPEIFDGYDPGWDFKPIKDETSYHQTVEELKTHRITQLERYIELISRDDYYAATRELNEITRRNPGPHQEGSPESDRINELMETMRRIGEETPTAVTAPAASKPFKFEPDPDANYRQVQVGLNGPDVNKVDIFDDANEATKSWLKAALGESELARILNGVDFDNQILIAYAIGERTTATGALYITEVSYHEILESMSVSARVGVNDHNCDIAPVTNYPFAVIVAERPAEVPETSGFSMANFADGCKQLKSANPNN